MSRHKEQGIMSRRAGQNIIGHRREQGIIGYRREQGIMSRHKEQGIISRRAGQNIIGHRREQNAMSRRTTELLLLLAACPIIVLLFVLAIFNNMTAFDSINLLIPFGLIAAFGLSHLALRRLAPNADPTLLPITFVLSGIGIAFIMRLAPNLAQRQVIWLFLGIAAMMTTLLLVRSVRKLGNYKYTIMILGVVLLLLPIIIGVEHNGSKLWLNIAGFSFQPGELAKILIVLFLAGYLADNREMLSVSGRRVGFLRIPHLKTLVPLVIMWALSLVIVVFERDLGSALLFFGIFVAMLYIATGRVSLVISAAVLGVAGAVAAFFIFEHVQVRVNIWLDPFGYQQGYQLTQALFSMADGNLIGTGIGRGLPTLIPVVASDFIFAAIAEEMGLIGASAVLILFVLFAIRGFTIASRARFDMEAFTAAGLTVAICLQAFVIVGGVTAFIPLTGVTLPFMSQGGSSLLASFMIVGLLLRTSDGATGHETELQSTVVFDGGVLGRFALGKRLTLLVTSFCVLFALLVANLTYNMVFYAPELNAMALNNHQMIKEARTQRGSILTSDGVILAESLLQNDGFYKRVYPEKSMAAHLVGYASSRFGLTGIEASQQEALRGSKGFNTWSEALNAMAGIPKPGNDVTLTIDSRIQAETERLLEGRAGGAVVLDAATGAILAMASSPTYDINTVEDILLLSGDGDNDSGNGAGSSTDSTGGNGDGNGDGGDNNAGDGELYNRVISALYSPGSTFKIVTLVSALGYAGIKLTDEYDAPGVIIIGGAPVTNFGGLSYGIVTVQEAFALSLNTVFGQMAETIGALTLVESANAFGFGQSLGLDFKTNASLMPNPADMTVWETAWAGAGVAVGEHTNSPAGPQVTVIQMAMIVAAFANDGIIMNPYVVAKISSAAGMTLSQTTPQVFGAITSSDVIASVNEAMEAVVTQGTASNVQINGYVIRGKTGTAEKSDNENDSWFVGYIEIGQRRIVVALVLEDAYSGEANASARQIFQKLIEVYA